MIAMYTKQAMVFQFSCDRFAIFWGSKRRWWYRFKQLAPWGFLLTVLDPSKTLDHKSAFDLIDYSFEKTLQQNCTEPPKTHPTSNIRCSIRPPKWNTSSAAIPWYCTVLYDKSHAHTTYCTEQRAASCVGNILNWTCEMDNFWVCVTLTGSCLINFRSQKREHSFIRKDKNVEALAFHKESEHDEDR